ncbi:MAG: quinol:electron acceptor oxidoreductase subunit ActD [Planctomycetota bacterium]
MNPEHAPGQGPEDGVHAVVAEFSHPHDLAAACEKVRDAGFTRWDAYTPFPVHGLDDAMGIKPTILPWVVLAGGITGCGGGLLLQYWANSIAYPFIISGKPMFSIPANVPIMFELTILLSAFAAFFGNLLMGGLPRFSNPLFRMPRFRRATSDRFFISIERSDPRFAEAKALLSGLAGAVVVEECPVDTSSDEIPRVVRYTGLTVGLLALAPFFLFFTARNTTSTEPQFHVVPDMDFQPKYKAQTENDMFADGRAMRLPVAGTVARGELRDDEHLQDGTIDGVWAKDLPPSITGDAAFMARGREVFAIYCSVCHGLDGRGDGLVTRRAQQKGLSWVRPTDMLQDTVRVQDIGQLYGTVKNGIRNMPSYAAQIGVRDRWAAVYYVRALQRAGYASLDDVPPGERAKLEKKGDD